MMNTINKVWFTAALIRAVRTIAQTAVSMLTLGLAVSEINWLHIASVSLVAGVYSILTSVATELPEVATDGTLEIDSTQSPTVYKLQLNTPLDELAAMKNVSFKVDPEAHISQE